MYPQCLLALEKKYINGSLTFETSVGVILDNIYQESFLTFDIIKYVIM